MKLLIVIVLFPCLLFAQLMPKYFSNTNIFNSTYSPINKKFNKTSTNKALTEFQKTDKELDKDETGQSPSDSIVKMKYEKKTYVDSSKIIYGTSHGFPIIKFSYCMGEDCKKDKHPLVASEILELLENDIKIRNKPNKYFNTAKLHYNIANAILASSVISVLAGFILYKNNIKSASYFTIGGLSAFILNGIVYSPIWHSIYLDDAINEYNKNLAY